MQKQRPGTGIEKVYGNIDKFLIKPDEFELGDIDSNRGMLKSFIDSTYIDPESTKNRKIQGLESIYTQRLQVRPSTGKARNSKQNAKLMFDSKRHFKPFTNNLIHDKSTNLEVISDVKINSDEVEQLKSNFRYPTITKRRNDR